MKKAIILKINENRKTNNKRQKINQNRDSVKARKGHNAITNFLCSGVAKIFRVCPSCAKSWIPPLTRLLYCIIIVQDNVVPCCLLRLRGSIKWGAVSCWSSVLRSCSPPGVERSNIPSKIHHYRLRIECRQANLAGEFWNENDTTDSWVCCTPFHY